MVRNFAILFASQRGMNMADMMGMLSTVIFDIVSTTLEQDLPQTSGFLLNGDVWKRDDSNQLRRILPITPHAMPLPNWFEWLRIQGKNEWLRHPVTKEIVTAINHDPTLLSLMSQMPPSIPGTSGTSPANPPAQQEEWVYERLILPLLTRALFPPQPRDNIHPQKVTERALYTYQEWRKRDGWLPRYAIAPLKGLDLPGDLMMRFDSEVVIRPICREDVEALLNPIPIYPFASHFLPFTGQELLAVRHVVEYRPKGEQNLSIDRVDRGITRVLLTLLTVFGPIITTPWLAVMNDVPSPMFIGQAEPHRRNPSFYSVERVDEPKWRARVDEVQTVYQALARIDDERVVTALTWYDKAAHEAEERSQLISAWIGLEALYGREQGEIIHKLSLRAAFYLSRHAEEYPNVEETFQQLKKLYVWRSSVVHGDRLKKSQSALSSAAAQSMELLRTSLRAILINGEKFPSTELLDKEIREALTY